MSLSSLLIHSDHARLGETCDLDSSRGRTTAGRFQSAPMGGLGQQLTHVHGLGVEPVIVENGMLAVEAWEGADWDVILMDVQMPVMDGPTAVRKIRERETVTGRPRTPILALTANAMSHQIAEYLSCGMDAHVLKPIEALKLYQALETALEARGDECAAHAA